MKTLSERLAYAMKETGFTKQTELARAAGVEQATISKILRGASETSKASGRLASAMGISADWLINGQGSIYGNSAEPLPQIDVSKRVAVWDENGKTDNEISWFNELPETCRAYIMNGATGVAQAPAGAIVIVNTAITPSANDLVVAITGGRVSVFRYHISGAGGGFLSVDDPRIPLAEVTDLSLLCGPIVQIFIPELIK